MSKDLSTARAKLGGTPDQWVVEEIGDGNVNMIFRVRGPEGQVLIKQSVPYLRCVGEAWPLSVQRTFFEYTAFKEHAAVAPQYLPQIYAYSADSTCMAMEFLGEHIILRKGLMQGIKYPAFAAHIADYMAKTLFFTSDLFLSAAQKKQKMKVFCDNTDLCKITEDLIFTDPYRESPQNRWTKPLLDPIVVSFHQDKRLKLAITEMKGKFLMSAEALVHGDLHSGSIMVNQTETKVIDPEFAFYGPMGFDVGLLLANFFMAYFSQEAMGSRQGERNEFEEWVLDQVQEIWVRFDQGFRGYWDTHLEGDYLSPNLFKGVEARELVVAKRDEYMANLFQDSIRFAAAEMIRRTLGLAHVADLDTIADPELKAQCEYRNLKMAYEMLVNPTQYSDLEKLLALAKKSRQLKISG